MKKILFLKTVIALLLMQQVYSQDCKTNAELETTPGKFLTAAQYPWPAVRAEYFNNLATAADKNMAKQTLGQIEKTEQQSHADFNLTGGNWENYYSTDGYTSYGNVRLGKYTFQSSLHEFFCAKGKLTRNDEANTILRIYVNAIPLNTLERFLRNPYGEGIGDYDLGFQYANWKDHKSSDVNAPLISLLGFMTCNSQPLLDAINTGNNNYFQDVPEKEIRPNNRNNYVYRYWFIKKKNLPVLVPVNRKEYLQGLLEYYEREKLYFPKLIDKLTKDRDAGVKQYSNWQADVADKISVVKKVLSDHNEEWLSVQAAVNTIEDASQNYKGKLTERTNYKRFWKFYDNEKRSDLLYKYNPEYFKAAAQNPAKPQIITIAFRYVSMPASLRVLNNFTGKFELDAVRKMVE